MASHTHTHTFAWHHFLWFMQTRLESCWETYSREQRHCSHVPMVKSNTCSRTFRTHSQTWAEAEITARQSQTDWIKRRYKRSKELKDLPFRVPPETQEATFKMGHFKHDGINGKQKKKRFCVICVSSLLESGLQNEMDWCQRFLRQNTDDWICSFIVSPCLNASSQQVGKSSESLQNLTCCQCFLILPTPQVPCCFLHPRTFE